MRHWIIYGLIALHLAITAGLGYVVFESMERLHKYHCNADDYLLLRIERIEELGGFGFDQDR